MFVWASSCWRLADVCSFAFGGKECGEVLEGGGGCVLVMVADAAGDDAGWHTTVVVVG